MVRVRMRVPHVTQRLVRKELLGFGDVRHATGFRLARFEHHHVVLELHEDRIVAAGSGCEPIETVTELLRRHGHRRWTSRSASRRRTAATAGRRRGCGNECGDVGRIQLRTRHVHIGERPAAARLDDLRGRHRAAEILPARVGGDDVHIAHDVFVEPRLDALNLILAVDIAVDHIALAGRRLHRRDSSSERCTCRPSLRWHCSRRRLSGSPMA